MKALRDDKRTGGDTLIRLYHCDNVWIDQCHIHHGDGVGITANTEDTRFLYITRNHIHHPGGADDSGEGMYLGANNSAVRMSQSIVALYHVHDCRGTQGDGIELKQGSFNNWIVENHVHDTNYPGILTYSTVGNGAPNIIEANVIWNTNDYGIQSAADSIIRNNIVLGSGIGLQAHQAGSPSNQVIVHNTVIGSGIEVRNVSGSVVIANNAVYSNSGSAIALISGTLSLVTVAGNVGVGGISGASGGFSTGSLAADFVAAHYNGAPPIDLFPKTGSALIGAGAVTHVTAEDFNVTARNGVADAGAYRFQAGGNPGWTLSPAFKAMSGTVGPNPPTNLTAN